MSKEAIDQDRIDKTRAALLDGIVTASKNSNSGDTARSLAEAYVILTSLSEENADQTTAARRYIDRRLEGRR
jgi:hypothetical protein